MTQQSTKALQESTLSLLKQIKEDTLTNREINELREVLRFHEYRYYIQSDPLISDFEYELEMNQLNRHLAGDIESVYLMASPQYSFLSSSGVKEIATFGGNVSNLVPDEVARRLKEALAR